MIIKGPSNPNHSGILSTMLLVKITFFVFHLPCYSCVNLTFHVEGSVQLMFSLKAQLRLWLLASWTDFAVEFLGKERDGWISYSWCSHASWLLKKCNFRTSDEVTLIVLMLIILLWTEHKLLVSSGFSFCYRSSYVHLLWCAWIYFCGLIQSIQFSCLHSHLCKIVFSVYQLKEALL